MHTKRGAVAMAITACVLTMRLAAQSSDFTAGGRELFVIDFATEPVGEFPAKLKALKGNMEVVDYEGSRMLRAASEGEFLIRLAEALPQDFTIEIDLVPRLSDAMPPDFMLEGTAERNRGEHSAEIVWMKASVSVIGGGAYTETPMPDELRETLAGSPVQVGVSFMGGTLKIYTNGQRVVSLTDQKFVRNRLLRVWLGGTEAGSESVYLKRIRVAGVTPAELASPTSPLPVVGAGGSTTSSSSAATGSPDAPAPQSVVLMPAISGSASATPVTATWPMAMFAEAGLGSLWGVGLAWPTVANAASYRVYRRSPESGAAPASVIRVLDFPELLTAVAEKGPYGQAALDPSVMFGREYTYWVEAVLADGRVTDPSPIATVKWPQVTVTMITSFPTVTGLKVVVGGTKQVSIPGSPAGAGSVPGSTLTWSWDPMPYVFAYEISHEVIGPGAGVPMAGLPGGSASPWTLLYRETIYATKGPQYAANGQMDRPAFVGAAPQGGAARFCVTQFGDLPRDAPLAPAGTTQPIQVFPLPNLIACMEATVP